ncbi:MAG: MauE/DoxX family redox-associated membrane protein [Tepidisphaeraceae bacterium]
MNVQRWLQIVVRFGLAAIFLYAATAKALRYDSGQIASNNIYGEWSRSNPLGHVLICGEAVLAIWLFSGSELSMAGVFTLAILSAFSGLVVLELGQEHPKPCGCMGSQSAVATNPNTIQSSLRHDLARNVVMMIGAAWLYSSARGRRRPAEFSNRATLFPKSLGNDGVGIADQTNYTGRHLISGPSNC